MNVHLWFDRAAVLPGAPGLHRLRTSREQWRQVAGELAASGGRLLALWASPDAGPAMRVHACYAAEPGMLVVELLLASAAQDYPGLEELFPAADRMQRAVADLAGVRSTARDTRPWLRHAAWPASSHPLVDATVPAAPANPIVDDYAFVRVGGEGVHEIPVGPVHAGIIEPGHFRFSIVGEKVLWLEERLGYVHKGIERRFTELALMEGHRLAARVSGDSAVAYSWAYCQALEGMAGVQIPPRAAWLRALCLEHERIANHLGDLGALGNDAGFAFGYMQFSRLKERWLRATERALGQRYLLDAVVPGGTRADLAATQAAGMLREVEEVRHEATVLRHIYDEHSGVRDRFVGAGQVSPALAARLGMCGLAGRASGQAFDLRCDAPWHPYEVLAPAKCGSSDGDVAARVSVRFDELIESCRLVQRIVDGMPAGAHLAPIPAAAESALGVGVIEAWRGPVLVALEAGAGGRIRRCHPHDPSWQNWPVLEHAIHGNIVPDFPLINKSFNLSYSGHDL
jgi:Ni,Fe-hydrogenase III large subunit/Ni,Fe-hydrogenase III component G